MVTRGQLSENACDGTEAFVPPAAGAAGPQAERMFISTASLTMYSSHGSVPVIRACRM